MLEALQWKLKRIGLAAFYLLALAGVSWLMFGYGSELIDWLSYGVAAIALIYPVRIIFKELKGDL